MTGCRYGAARCSSGRGTRSGIRGGGRPTSAAVNTACTPGTARAPETSTALIRACATALRKIAACHCPSRRRSSTYAPRPRRNRRSSPRSTGAPIYVLPRPADPVRSTGPSSIGGRTSSAGRDELVDLRISRHARQRGANLVGRKIVRKRTRVTAATGEHEGIASEGKWIEAVDLIADLLDR